MTIAEAEQRVLAGRGPGRVTIGVRGVLEGATIGAFDKTARAAMEPGMDVVVDLSEVTGMAPEAHAALAAVGALVQGGQGSFSIRPPSAAVDLAPELARLLHPAGRCA